MATVSKITNRARHWFWHFWAVAFVCDLYQSGLSDEEWRNYVTFMRSKGFSGCP